MIFHWSLSHSKSPQVSRTLLSILAVLNNAVVWMVSTRPPTSKSSTPFNNPLVTLPKAPVTIGIIVTFMFHSFFNSLAKLRYYHYYYYYPKRISQKNEKTTRDKTLQQKPHQRNKYLGCAPSQIFETLSQVDQRWT